MTNPDEIKAEAEIVSARIWFQPSERDSFVGWNGRVFHKPALRCGNPSREFAEIMYWSWICRWHKVEAIISRRDFAVRTLSQRPLVSEMPVFGRSCRSGYHYIMGYKRRIADFVNLEKRSMDYSRAQYVSDKTGQTGNVSDKALHSLIVLMLKPSSCYFAAR